ncbi:hypothetical protein [Phenylobacterium sp.]|uniref:hypothetical protein n=1 Tax=Phenylobacterium sp. TaxID=1871053 RepID=UPI002FD96741
MTLNLFVRKLHRWLSLAFTLAVLANIAVMFSGAQIMWVGFLALVPLIPLLITGVYLFALPYLGARRDGAMREAN